MGMSTGSSSGPKSDINITPLVDVVLVLLIIFMVVTPMTQLGYEVQVPPKLDAPVAPPSNDQLIVRMDETGKTFINKGTNGRWRDTLSAAEIAAYDAKALAELGPACAAWLANGRRADL